MINLEIPKKFGGLIGQANQVATEIFRPNSRKYDRAEHEYPKELDMLAARDRRHERERRARRAPGGPAGVRTAVQRRPLDRRRLAAEHRQPQRLEPRQRAELIELCWGDVGLLLTMPAPGARPGRDRRRRQRGAARSASAASGRRWRSPSPRPARTRPRSARPRCSLDGDEYVLNGEKIFVTSGDRAELIVVWATLDRSQGAPRSSRSWSSATTRA
jgi:acyl-CoA dehydrogenase